MTVKKLAAVLAIAVAAGAATIPGSSAAATRAGGGGSEPRPTLTTLYGAVTPETKASCQHLYGSLWACQAKLPWGSVDYLCDTDSQLCIRQ